MTREADTNAKIVMLMKVALAETKHCRNEQQRQEFHVGLSYVMPPREGERSSRGWIRRICEQLDVQRGKRMDGRAAARVRTGGATHWTDCEVLRAWVLKGLFCQWMMTLNSGRDVSE